MKLKYNFVTNEVAGNKVAVAVGDDAASFNGFIKLNTTAYEIFSLLKNDISKEEIVARLSEIYPDETLQTLETSVEGFLKKLDEAGVLINE